MPLFSTTELQSDLARVAAALRDVTVIVQNGGRQSRSHGSGIVWSPDGLVVTSSHVAEQGATTVTFADGRTAPARLVARDPKRDLALLRIDTDALGHAALRSATVGEPSALRPGDLVLALGHPLGVPHSLALGVVHAVTHSPRAPYVAADIRLAPGNSGGPLADARGSVVGVNCMIAGGLGVAVSVDAVRRLVAAVQARRAA